MRSSTESEESSNTSPSSLLERIVKDRVKRILKKDLLNSNSEINEKISNKFIETNLKRYKELFNNQKCKREEISKDIFGDFFKLREEMKKTALLSDGSIEGASEVMLSAFMGEESFGWNEYASRLKDCLILEDHPHLNNVGKTLYKIESNFKTALQKHGNNKFVASKEFKSNVERAFSFIKENKEEIQGFLEKSSNKNNKLNTYLEELISVVEKADIIPNRVNKEYEVHLRSKLDDIKKMSLFIIEENSVSPIASMSKIELICDICFELYEIAKEHIYDDYDKDEIVHTIFLIPEEILEKLEAMGSDLLSYDFYEERLKFLIKVIIDSFQGRRSRKKGFASLKKIYEFVFGRDVNSDIQSHLGSVFFRECNFHIDTDSKLKESLWFLEEFVSVINSEKFKEKESIRNGSFVSLKKLNPSHKDRSVNILDKSQEDFNKAMFTVLDFFMENFKNLPRYCFTNNSTALRISVNLTIKIILLLLEVDNYKDAFKEIKEEKKSKVREIKCYLRKIIFEN